MRFYGKLIAQVCGQTKGKHLLVDRIAVVYVTKERLGYIFVIILIGIGIKIAIY